MKTTYFAYGSNLSMTQMRDRCPSARLVATAELPNHDLAFAGHSHAWRGGVATVYRSKGRRVPGLVYELSLDDLHLLDGFEGVPYVYDRVRRVVRLPSGDRRIVFVYGLARPTPRAIPSGEYFGILHRAYREHGFSLGALSSALDFRKERVQ